MGRSTRIYIEAPRDPEELALLIEPITETDASVLVRQWALGTACIGPYDQRDAQEIVRALRHFGLSCRLAAPPQQLSSLPAVQVSATQSASVGRYVYSASQKERKRGVLSRLFGRESAS